MRTGERIPRVTASTPMPAAIHEMSRKMMGITAVVNGGGRLSGVISDGDLRRTLEEDPQRLRQTAGDCCRPEPRTISADAFATAALETMESSQDHVALRRRRRGMPRRGAAHARPAVGRDAVRESAK